MEKQISIVEMSRSRELRVNLTEFKGYDRGQKHAHKEGCFV